MNKDGAPAGLKARHRAPSDLLLIPQARIEGHTIVSACRLFARHGVQVVW